mgnify:CR=1 FL=1
MTEVSGVGAAVIAELKIVEIKQDPDDESLQARWFDLEELDHPTSGMPMSQPRSGTLTRGARSTR